MVDWKTPARQALHVSGCPETLLETAPRHVREGAERVTRHEAMVAELEGDNHPDAATFAQGSVGDHALIVGRRKCAPWRDTRWPTTGIGNDLQIGRNKRNLFEFPPTSRRAPL
jgi:hypothetical protein